MGARHTLRYGLGIGPTAGAFAVVLVTVWAALSWAPQHSQFAIGSAVTVVGAIALQRRARHSSLAAELLVLAALAGIGVIASQYTWAFIPLALAVGLAAGLMWTLGSVAGLIGVALIATLLATTRIPPTLGSALTTAGFVISGGLLQIAITSAYVRSQVRPVVSTRVAGPCESRPRQRVIGQIRWDSPLFRHALRLTAGVGAALALLVIRDIPEDIWIPLAVVLILRPGPAQNAVRYAERIASSAAGIILASSISMVWSLAPWLSAVTVALCLIGAYLAKSWLRIGAVCAAITVAMDASQTVDSAMFSDRLFAAGIGAAIAVWMFALIPDPLAAKVSYRVGELLQAELAYAAAEIAAFIRPSSSGSPTRRAARDRALAAATVFNGHTAPLDIAARSDVQALSVAVAALDTQLPRGGIDMYPSLLAAADEYMAALKGCQTPCHSGWHLDVRRLDAADQALRSAAGIDPVLGTHVGAITRHARSLDALLSGATR